MARPHPALIELAAGRRPPPSVPDPDVLVRSAVEHRMHGLLWSAVERGEIDVPLAAEKRLGVLFLRTREHHRRLWAALEKVTSLLAEHGIEVATFKGVTAEGRWYDRMGERPSRDLDLWLSPHQFNRATDAARIIDPNHALVPALQDLVSTRALQSIDLQIDGIPVDLHFDPLKLGIWSPHLARIWDRTSIGATYRTFHDVDAVIQLLLHLIKDRFSWLLGLSDIRRMLISPDLLNAVISTSAQMNFGRLARSSLHTLHHYLDLSPANLGTPSWVWRLIWPSSLLLQGSDGILRARKRQYFIPLLVDHVELAQILRFYWRLLFPPSALLDFRHPDVPGPYLAKAIVGRLRRLREHRQLIAMRSTR